MASAETVLAVWVGIAVVAFVAAAVYMWWSPLHDPPRQSG